MNGSIACNSNPDSECIECPICIEPFGVGEDRPHCVSNCDHVFHKRCILRVIQEAEAAITSTETQSKVSVPCPMCRKPVKKKHVKLNTVLTKILDNSAKYLTSFIYAPLRPPTAEDHRAAVAEFKKIIDCVVDIQEELIHEFEAEIAFMKKKMIINKVCIGCELVGTVLFAFCPIAGAVIVTGANVIRLSTNLYQVCIKSKRKEKIENLFKRKNSLANSDRVQRFLAYYNRIYEKESQITNQDNNSLWALTAASASISAIAIGAEIVMPLNLFATILSCGLGAAAGLASVFANTYISRREGKIVQKETKTYESMIQALKEEKQVITYHQQEIVKRFE